MILDYLQTRLNSVEMKLNFLGYLIKDGKRYPAPEKVEAIDNWVLPTNANQ